MRYLKLILIMVVCLGVLFVSAALYADELNREDIRARESSTQRAEGVAETWRSYEARISAYEKLLPEDKIALEDYLKNKASSSERAEFLSGRGIISGSGAGQVPAGTPLRDGTPAVPNIPQPGPIDGTPGVGSMPPAPPVTPPAVNPPVAPPQPPPRLRSGSGDDEGGP